MLRGGIKGRHEAGALETWQRDDSIDPTVSMRALVLLLVGADLGMSILSELGVRAPPPTNRPAEWWNRC
jgi:hypothetical protein